MHGEAEFNKSIDHLSKNLNDLGGKLNKSNKLILDDMVNHLHGLETNGDIHKGRLLKVLIQFINLAKKQGIKEDSAFTLCMSLFKSCIREEYLDIYIPQSVSSEFITTDTEKIFKNASKKEKNLIEYFLTHEELLDLPFLWADFFDDYVVPFREEMIKKISQDDDFSENVRKQEYAVNLKRSMEKVYDKVFFTE